MHTYHGTVMVGTYQEARGAKPKPCILINEEHVIDVETGQPPKEVWEYKKLPYQGVLPIFTVNDTATKGMKPSTRFTDIQKEEVESLIPRKPLERKPLPDLGGQEYWLLAQYMHHTGVSKESLFHLCKIRGIQPPKDPDTFFNTKKVGDFCNALGIDAGEWKMFEGQNSALAKEFK